MFGQFIESVVPWKRKATKLVGPTIEKLTKIPMPSDVVFDDIENLVAKIDGLRKTDVE